MIRYFEKFENILGYHFGIPVFWFWFLWIFFFFFLNLKKKIVIPLTSVHLLDRKYTGMIPLHVGLCNVNRPSKKNLRVPHNRAPLFHIIRNAYRVKQASNMLKKSLICAEICYHRVLRALYRTSFLGIDVFFLTPILLSPSLPMWTCHSGYKFGAACDQNEDKSTYSDAYY